MRALVTLLVLCGCLLATSNATTDTTALSIPSPQSPTELSPITNTDMTSSSSSSSAVVITSIDNTGRLGVPGGRLSWSSGNLFASFSPWDSNLGRVHVTFSMAPRTAALTLNAAQDEGTTISVVVDGVLEWKNITVRKSGLPPVYVNLGPPFYYVVLNDQTGQVIAQAQSYATQLDEVMILAVQQKSASITRGPAAYQCKFQTSVDAAWETGWVTPTEDFGVDCIVKKPLGDLNLVLVEVQRAWTTFGISPSVLAHTGGPQTITLPSWYYDAVLTNSTRLKISVGESVTVSGSLSTKSKYICQFILPGGQISVVSSSSVPTAANTLKCSLPAQILNVGALQDDSLTVQVLILSADGTKTTTIQWVSFWALPAFKFDLGQQPQPISTGRPSPSTGGGGTTGTGGQQNNNGGGSDDSVTIGASVAGCIMVLAVAGTVIYFQRQKRKKNRLPGDGDGGSSDAPHQPFARSPASQSSSFTSYANFYDYGTKKKKKKKDKKGGSGSSDVTFDGQQQTTRALPAPTPSSSTSTALVTTNLV